MLLGTPVGGVTTKIEEEMDEILDDAAEDLSESSECQLRLVDGSEAQTDTWMVIFMVNCF